ncbi:MAG TPA: glycosyltransferase family 4 protein [Pyrinomonadaceae bacterium]|nr:glycosyltransferase family 4 protein [Pyrinomonadaceae bacterium]
MSDNVPPIDEVSSKRNVKIALVLLSGDIEKAKQEIVRRFPGAALEVVLRAEIESGTLASRINALRKHHPDVLVFVTELLAWQRRQDIFMLLGAMAGAREVIILDHQGSLRREPRGKILLSASFRAGSEAILGAKTVSRTRRELSQLESEIENRQQPAKLRQSEEPQIVYLRATPGPGTQAGGAASHIKGVTGALVELGAEMRFISNDAIAGLNGSQWGSQWSIIEPEPHGGTRAIFEIHNNSIFTRGALPLIEHDPPDFIYQRYARFGWAGVVASLRTGRPLFLEYNGSEVWVGRHWDHVGMLNLLERFERLNLNAAARIFVVSDVERRNLEQAGIAHEKIVVNPNGVDPNTFRPDVGGVALRTEMGVGDETLAGFVGSFGPWHGVSTLAEAIKAIPKASRVRFLLVGSGSLHAKVKQLLAAEEESGRVIFTGSVEHDQVPALLDACDVLVSPHVPLADGSEFFGSPTKIFEYMAMGKGIVASRLGQIGEVLQDEVSALLVEPDNAKQLSDAIVRLAESPALREHLGKAARQTAIERHTWRRNAQNVLDAYSAWLAEAN